MRTELYLQISEQVCTLIQRVYQLQTMQPRTKEENFHSNVVNTMYMCYPKQNYYSEQIFIISTCTVAPSVIGNPLGEENVSLFTMHNVLYILISIYLFTSPLGAITTFFLAE